MYAMLKVGAIGALVGLRFVLVRRSKAQEEAAPPEPAPARKPHPVSKKKRRKRRG